MIAEVLNYLSSFFRSYSTFSDHPYVLSEIQQKRTFFGGKPLSNMSGKRDSNPRPSAWEADALPTELLPHFEDANLIQPSFLCKFGSVRIIQYFYFDKTIRLIFSVYQ